MSKQKATRKEKFSAQPSVKSAAIENSNKLNLWLALIVGLFAFLLYANTLGFKYTLDDYSVILENKSTKKGFDAIGEIFKTTYRYGFVFGSDNLYRPLSKALLAIEWGIAPEKPMLGHLVNVLLFALSGFVLFRTLLEWLKGNNVLAFIISMIFIAMPVHTEVISNIKSVDEILSFLFGILALRSVFRYANTQKNSFLLSSGVWFLLALLSKESSITFLALVPLVVYFFNEQDLKKSIAPGTVFLLVCFLFMVIRTKIVGTIDVSGTGLSVVDNMLIDIPDKLTKLTTAVFMLSVYLKAIVVGYPLSFDNSFPQLPVAGLDSWRFWLSAILFTGLLVYALIAFKKRNLASFALLFFFITVSVSSNIFMMIGTHYGERLMYVPSFGISMLIAVLLYRYIPSVKGVNSAALFFSSNKNILTATTVLFLLYGGLTVARNPVWTNNTTLYESGLISAPNSCRVQFYMGNHLVKKEQLEGKTPAQQDSILNLGIVYLKKSLELCPKFTDAWTQLGVAYSRLKNPDESIRCYLQALKSNPNDPVVRNNLGAAYFNRNKYSEAIEHFQMAIRLNRNYAEAYSNLGSVYGTTGKYDDAIDCFMKAIKTDPKYATAYYFLGLTWRNKGNELNAQQYLDKAYELDPSLRK